MCRNISQVEWSGVLFYHLIGEFGADDFKVELDDIFLMDIGTSVYTEYEWDQDIIKHMMENPTLLESKKGHIHSHNNMSVFFSGTDKQELHDNSPFHNFYLSLIVNNRNDMEAKISFVSKIKSKTESTVTFRNASGEWVSSTSEGEAPEKEALCIYNCDIVKPEVVDETFFRRFINIRDVVAKREEEERIKKQFTSYGQYSSMGQPPKHQGSYDIGGRYPTGDKKEKAASGVVKSGKVSSQGTLYSEWGEELTPTKGIYPPLTNAEKWVDDDIKEVGKISKNFNVPASFKKHLVKEQKKNQRSKSFLPATKSPSILEGFIVKMLKQDLLCEDDLKVVLKKMNKYLVDQAEIESMGNNIINNSVAFYEDQFGNDPHLYMFEATMGECEDLLIELGSDYPIAAVLAPYFKIELIASDEFSQEDDSFENKLDWDDQF